MKNIQRHSGDSGFTLLEIMLSISILVVITFAATNLVSMSFDMRFELFNASNVTKRMNTAMQRMVMDLEHVFVLDRLDQERNTKDRGMKTIFRI